MSLLRRISVGKKQEENVVAPEKPVKPEGWSEAEFFVWQSLLASVDDAECLVVIKDGELVSKLDKMTENLKKSGKKIETEEDLFNCMVDIINENIDFDESTEEN